MLHVDDRVVEKPFIVNEVGKMCKELPNGSAGGESGLVYVHVKHVAHVSSIKMMKEFI